MKHRKDIALGLIALGEKIAQEHKDTKESIESISCRLVPLTGDEDVDAEISDVVESWAYTWLDFINGGIRPEDIDYSDKLIELTKLPIESLENSAVLWQIKSPN